MMMATRPTYGQLSEFHPESESISTNVNRAWIFFFVNDIAAVKQPAVFGSVIGGKIYSLLRQLLSLGLPQKMSWVAITHHWKAITNPSK